MSTTEQPNAADSGSELTDQLGPCREAFERIAAPNFFAPEDALLQDHWQTWQEAWEAATAAERERWKAALEERGRMHGESSRIYARLASAVRGGASDTTLGRLLRAEVEARPNAELTCRPGLPGLSGRTTG